MDLRALTWVDQAFAQRVPGELGGAAQAELVHHVCPMRFYRLDGDVQQLGNLPM